MRFRSRISACIAACLVALALVGAAWASEWEVMNDGRVLPTSSGQFLGQEHGTDDETVLIQQFVKWLDENGNSDTKWPRQRLSIQQIEGEGVGVVAMSDIESGDLLLSSPPDLMLDVASSFQQPLLGQVLRDEMNSIRIAFSDEDIPTSESIEKFVLSIRLLYERQQGDESFWKPYLNMLPVSVSSPLFFNDEELREVQSPFLIEQTRKRRDFLEARHHGVVKMFIKKYPDIFKEEFFTFNNFAWASSMVSSRVYRLGKRVGFVPMFDMFNHQSNNITQALPSFNHDKKVYHMRSDRHYNVGEQVYISYGEKSNFLLFLGYGFVLADTSEQVYKLPLDLLDNDPFQVVKDRVFKLYPHFDIRSKDVYELRVDRIPEDVLAAFRMASLSAQEMSTDNAYELAFHGLPVSLGNEYKALSRLRRTCTSLLQQYATTLDEDVKLLESSSQLPERHRLAVVYRISEKEVLEKTISLVDDLWNQHLVDQSFKDRML